MQPRPDFDPSGLLDLLTDVVYAVDPEGCFVYVNPAGVKLFGRDLDELLGQHLLTVVDDSSADEVMEHFRRGLADAGSSPYYEVRVRRPDGEVRDVEVHAGPLLRDGRPVGRQGVGRDITEVRRLQLDLADKTRRLALIEERYLQAQEIYHRLSSLAETLTQHPVDVGRTLDSLEDSVRSSRAQSLGLDVRDMEVIRLVAEGWSNNEVAAHIHVSVHTVKDRVARIVERLGARSRAGIGVAATRAGIL